MAASTLRVGLFQMDIRWEDPAENINHVARHLDAAPRMDLLILPEMWSTGFSMNPEAIAEAHPGQAAAWMRTRAMEDQMVIAGSLAVRDNGAFFNRMYVYHPDGSSGHYDKKHLFTYAGEHQHYTPGNSQFRFDINGWKVAGQICYDLRFPTWCRNTDDYDLMLVVANWPAPRIHHWDLLLRARAVENQCFVAGVNRCGVDGNGLQYPGHSAVISPSGDSLASPAGEKLEVIDLRYDELSGYRTKYPFLRDRDSLIL